MTQGGEKTIVVWAKFRPAAEDGGNPSCVSHVSPTSVQVAPQASALKTERRKAFVFNFDRTLDQSVTQEDVFEHGLPAVIDQAFLGRSVLVSTYGQTGSGKTYTMCGDLEPGGRDAGILPRAVQYCFDRSREVSIQVQMLEIYNEELRDLLCSDNPSPKRLQICNDRKFGTTVPGLHLAPASEASEALACIRQGIERRRTSETKVNKASSRSHVLCFLVLSDAVSGEVISRIGMCDLAGSERQNKTGTSGHKLKEGGSINRSLSALERVVSGIHDYQKQKQKGSMSHVNFRDSKLTRILQPFLSGRGSSVFILCVSALPGNAHETLNTMKFGQRLQGISQQPFVLQVAPASPMSGTHRRNLEAEFAAAGAGDRQKQERDQAFARLLARECAWSLLSFVLYSSLSGAFRALWS